MFIVIPAKAGIQLCQMVVDFLDSGFHRSDDFLRNHRHQIVRKILFHGFLNINFMGVKIRKRRILSWTKKGTKKNC